MKINENKNLRKFQCLILLLYFLSVEPETGEENFLLEDEDELEEDEEKLEGEEIDGEENIDALDKEEDEEEEDEDDDQEDEDQDEYVEVPLEDDDYMDVSLLDDPLSASSCPPPQMENTTLLFLEQEELDNQEVCKEQEV